MALLKVLEEMRESSTNMGKFFENAGKDSGSQQKASLQNFKESFDDFTKNMLNWDLMDLVMSNEEVEKCSSEVNEILLTIDGHIRNLLKEDDPNPMLIVLLCKLTCEFRAAFNDMDTAIRKIVPRN